jgi:phosphoglycolate phosphatase
VTAVLFDLDGTHVDSLPGIRGSLNRGLAALGFPGHPPAAVRGFIGDGSWWLSRRALPASAPDSMVGVLEEHFKADYAQTWAAGTHPFPGIPELLAELADSAIPLAVLSNKPHPFTVEIVATLFPGIPFAAVRGELSGTPRKPDPAGAIAIARALRLDPADILFVGDSRVDSQTAASAGMPAAIVAWGYDDHAMPSAPHWCHDIPALRRALTR